MEAHDLDEGIGASEEAGAGGEPGAEVTRKHRHPILERLQLRDRIRAVGDSALDRTEVSPGSVGRCDGAGYVVADGGVGVEPQRVGRRDRRKTGFHERRGVRPIDLEPVDTPAFALELLGEVGHERSADLQCHQHVGLIPKQIGTPLEITRVAEERHDDREIIRPIHTRLDRASSPP
jgi:hypothetical protein